uniref:Uncharacterized protein n=1 Tax=Medicago truncatula TaxID=3880 RepID=I3SB60_MEDTR|nr:unknown [Medicago truncatula]
MLRYNILNSKTRCCILKLLECKLTEHRPVTNLTSIIIFSIWSFKNRRLNLRTHTTWNESRTLNPHFDLLKSHLKVTKNLFHFQ